MTRRQEIENIIIGTILNNYSGEDYMNDCKCCITADMFADKRNEKIYAKVFEMQKSGYNDITPYDIVAYNEEMIEYASYMCELASDWHFLYKKVLYNERQWLRSLSSDYNSKYTYVQFTDYINKFIQLVFSS